ncbi:MAG: hypothetical protein J1E82_09875 [Muribaculaceae bacterium]|nr:hypothetical protein [Muribaculaceae bacterium]
MQFNNAVNAPVYYPDYKVEINSGAQFLFSITYMNMPQEIGENDTGNEELPQEMEENVTGNEELPKKSGEMSPEMKNCPKKAG